MKTLLIGAATGADGLLVADAAAAQSSAPTPPCRDPWVSQAVKEVTGREALGAGELGECNIQLYGARWGSYAELKGYVEQAFTVLKKSKLEFDGKAGKLYDRMYYPAVYYPANTYVGARGGMPRDPQRNWVIDLPGGNVIAIQRPCRPGYSSVGTGCVKNGGFNGD